MYYIIYSRHALRLSSLLHKLRGVGLVIGSLSIYRTGEATYKHKNNVAQPYQFKLVVQPYLLVIMKALCSLQRPKWLAPKVLRAHVNSKQARRPFQLRRCLIVRLSKYIGSSSAVPYWGPRHCS